MCNMNVSAYTCLIGSDRVLSDKWLSLRFKQGSKTAFSRIYKRYRDDLLRLATSLLNEKPQAEDVVHEAFIALVEARESFRITGNLKGYLITSVVNRARNLNRNLNNRQRLHPDPNYLDRRQQRPDEWALCSEQYDRLRQALAGLPYDQREVIALHIRGQLTFQDIAQMQKVSIKTVQSRYRYGLNKLRVLLNGEVQP